jgi:TPR repeat protein
MRFIFRYLLFTCALAAPLSAHAGASMLRISCEGINVGAEVKINGKFRGECPVDLQVSPGILKLNVTKKKDKESFWLFEQDVRVGEDSVKKVEVAMHWRYNEATLKRMKAPLKEIISAANKGQALEQLELGHRTADPRRHADRNSGIIITKSYSKAFNWYLKAAEQGYAPAQISLGVLYSLGQQENFEDNVPQDYNKAMEWYRKAADHGSAEAMAKIGDMYFSGEGVQINYPDALQWYSKAADQGALEGETGLARMYYAGKGVEKNVPEAIRRYRRAADHGRGDWGAKMALEMMGLPLDED